MIRLTKIRKCINACKHINYTTTTDNDFVPALDRTDFSLSEIELQQLGFIVTSYLLSTLLLIYMGNQNYKASR